MFSFLNVFCFVGSVVLIGGYLAKTNAQVKSGIGVCTAASDLSNSNELCGSPSSTSPYPFREVKNFRDIASASSKLKPGLIYRTGSVSRGTEEDVSVLRDSLKIKTFIDLRSATELQDDPALNSTLYKDYQSWKYVEGSYLPYSEEDAALSTDKFRYFVSLLSEELLVKSLIRRLSVLGKVQAFTLIILSKISRRANNRLRSFILSLINDGGLFLLNELMIDIAGKEIVAVLKLLAEPNHYPIAFYCTAGKDRTGIIAMFLLSILDATDEEILRDYQISDTVYQDMNDSQAVVASLQQSDVNTSVFLRATPDIIQHAMNYVRQEYGSINSYLNRYGFDESWRLSLQKLLVLGTTD